MSGDPDAAGLAALDLLRQVAEQTAALRAVWGGFSVWTPDQVHEIRLHGKRLRAMSAWLACDRADAREWGDAVRRSGRLLADARRHEVCGRLLANLASAVPARWSRHLQDRAGDWLSPSHTCPSACADVLDGFSAWCEMAMGRDQADPAPGLDRLLRRERALRKKALAGDSLDRWHKWRRHAKYLGFLHHLQSSRKPGDDLPAIPHPPKRATHWVGEAHDAADTLALLGQQTAELWHERVNDLLRHHIRESLAKARRQLD